MATLQDMIDAGNAALREGRTADAGALFESAAAQAPDEPALLSTLAGAFASLEDWPRAADYAVRACAFLPGTPPERGVTVCLTALYSLYRAGRGEELQQHAAAIRTYLIDLLEREGDEKALHALANQVFRAAILARDGEVGVEWMGRIFIDSAIPIAEAAVSDSATLAYWCARSGTTLHTLIPAQHIVARNGSTLLEVTAEPVRVAIVPRGEVLCGWGFVITPDRLVLADSGHNPLARNEVIWLPHVPYLEVNRVLHPWATAVQEIDADVIYLPGPIQFHVGHWIVDFLTQLHALTQSAFRHYNIAITRELPQKNRDLLALFGIGAERLVECTFGARYRFRNVAAFERRESSTLTLPQIRCLRDSMGPPATLPPPQRRVFLTRSVPTRKITNQAEFDATLARHGFAAFDLATASIAEQRAVLGETEIAISVFGSDLLAVLFMQRHADFIEMKYRPDLVSHMDIMFSALSVNHHLLMCAPAARPGAQRMKKDNDFAVDCAQLAAVLGEIAARKQRGQDCQEPLDIQVRDIPPPSKASA